MRILIAQTGLAALTLLAMSAPTAQAQSFNGAYAGVHAGARWNNAHVVTPQYVAGILTDTLSAQDYTFGATSFIGGGHVGYNFAAAPGLLAGVEADIDFGDAGASAACVDPSCAIGGTQTRTTLKLGTQGTARLRLGVVAGPALIYATGGLAIADVSWQHQGTVGTDFATTSLSQLRTGWALGGGAETFVAPKIMLRAEYLYEDFGSMTVPLAGADFPDTDKGSVGLTAQKVRLGLSYKF